MKLYSMGEFRVGVALSPVFVLSKFTTNSSHTNSPVEPSSLDR